MRQNSIDYPGERAPRRADIVEQPGYTGKHYFVVDYAGRQLTVHAADETAALFWAAKRWGYSFKRPEYHQTASVDTSRTECSDKKCPRPAGTGRGRRSLRFSVKIKYKESIA